MGAGPEGRARLRGGAERGAAAAEAEEPRVSDPNLKEKILRCPREHRGDCELVPLEKDAPLDDNCQRGAVVPRQPGPGAEICVLH